LRTIAVVTVGRSDFGIYLPVLRAIQSDPELSLHLIVTGGHLSATFGWTVNEIVAQGFEIGDRVDTLLSADTPEAIAISMGLGTLGLAQVYARVRPDLLLVLGDRYEMHAAAIAAVPFRIPIAHVHGGEVTHGAIDDALRHAITKYSHLHFASTEEHARRIVQLGEEPWRVTVSGAPSLDNLKTLSLMSQEELEAALQLKLDQSPIAVTFHPVTLQYEQTERQVDQLLTALAQFDAPMVITKANADTNGQTIIRKMEEFARERPRVRLVDNLGTRGYFSLMSRAAALVGNSSSGIIEAASFELPVVNVGLRQSGRPRSGNVIDVDCEAALITGALQRALDPNFKSSLRGIRNVYGDGTAARGIVERLRTTPLDARLTLKRFHDLPVTQTFSREAAAA
jgi:UDP-hydrolysing UDP-N-acetyl-D-glucosamine 2-epimerase